MEFSDAELEARARSAFERGRIRFALSRTALLIPCAALLPLLAVEPTSAAAAAGVFLVAAFGLLYRGGASGRAILPGLVAGGIAFVLPSLPRCVSGICPAGLCATLCVGGAVTGGFLAGLLLAFRARRLPEDRDVFLWSAAAIALPLGISGCLVAGSVGLVGMASGFLAGTSPILVPQRPR
jgi:hypothetical protein